MSGRRGADGPAVQAAPAEYPWRSAQSWRLPGTRPLAQAPWLWIDDAHAAQMAERERLLDERRGLVLALEPEGRAAAGELLAAVLEALRGRADARVGAEAVTRPDGVTVALNADDPLGTVGRLVQEDFCLLVRRPDDAEHRLAGAVLCFPSGWTLAEKIGRPLVAIHSPVAAYDADIARRVQRLCDGVRPGQPVVRANALFHDTPTLFAPRPEADPRPRAGADAPWLRVERQVLARLPETGAVVFSIHTSIVPRERLSGEDLAALAAVS